MQVTEAFALCKGGISSNNDARFFLLSSGHFLACFLAFSCLLAFFLPFLGFLLCCSGLLLPLFLPSRLLPAFSWLLVALFWPSSCCRLLAFFLCSCLLAFGFPSFCLLLALFRPSSGLLVVFFWPSSFLLTLLPYNLLRSFS